MLNKSKTNGLKGRLEDLSKIIWRKVVKAVKNLLLVLIANNEIYVVLFMHINLVWFVRLS
jgi:hypothetical protein